VPIIGSGSGSSGFNNWQPGHNPIFGIRIVGILDPIKGWMIIFLSSSFIEKHTMEAKHGENL
jgi:hypothetical protein